MATFNFKFKEVELSEKDFVKEGIELDSSAAPTLKVHYSPELRACKLALEELLGMQFCEDPRDNHIAISTAVDNLSAEIHDHMLRANIARRMADELPADAPLEAKLGIVASFYLHDAKMNAELNKIQLKHALYDLMHTGKLL